MNFLMGFMVASAIMAVIMTRLDLTKANGGDPIMPAILVAAALFAGSILLMIGILVAGI